MAPADSELLAVRLINKSGNNSLDYVFIQTYTIDNPVNIPVNSDFEIVGLVPNDGRMYVTSIILFDKNKVPMEIGAAYFMYDAQGKGLKAVTYSETFPESKRMSPAPLVGPRRCAAAGTPCLNFSRAASETREAVAVTLTRSQFF